MGRMKLPAKPSSEGRRRGLVRLGNVSRVVLTTSLQRSRRPKTTESGSGMPPCIGWRRARVLPAEALRRFSEAVVRRRRRATSGTFIAPPLRQTLISRGFSKVSRRPKTTERASSCERRSFPRGTGRASTEAVVRRRRRDWVLHGAFAVASVKSLQRSRRPEDDGEESFRVVSATAGVAAASARAP